jgi:hypothetical protein
MKAFRVTIAGMMALVLIVALLQVAVRNADAFWAAAAVTLALVTLALLGLNAFVSPSGPKRAASVGAVVLGGGYFVLCFLPPFEQSLRPLLLTSECMTYIHPRLHYGSEAGIYLYPPYNSEKAQVWVKDQAGQDKLITASLVNWGDNRPQFERLCHALLSLALTCAGGPIGRWCWLRSRCGDVRQPTP